MFSLAAGSRASLPHYKIPQLLGNVLVNCDVVLPVVLGLQEAELLLDPVDALSYRQLEGRALRRLQTILIRLATALGPTHL